MNEPTHCPACGSDDISYKKKHDLWKCDECGHRWKEGQKVSRRQPQAGPEEQWPSPIAVPTTEYRGETHPIQKLWAAADFIEILARFAVTIRASELAPSGQRLPQKVAARVREYVELPTLGKWRRVAEELVGEKPESAFIPELPSFLKEHLFPLLDGPKEKRARSPENSFLSLRNLLAHGGGISKKAAARYGDMWNPSVNGLMDELSWLSEIRLGVQTEEGWISLTGSEQRKSELTRADEEAASATGLRTVALRSGSALGLFPLVVYGPAYAPGADIGAESDEHATQMYLRREDERLHYNAIGSERAPISEGSVEAAAAFETLFRLGERETSQKRARWRVDGFETELRREADKLLGRNSELEHLKKTAFGTEEGLVWVSGVAGIGKSCLMASLYERIVETKDEQTIVLPYRFKATDPRCSGVSFLAYMAERLTAFTGIKVKEREKPQETVRRAFKALEGRRVIVVADGLDEIEQRESGFLSTTLLPLRAPGTLWILAGRPLNELEEAADEAWAIRPFPYGLTGLDEGTVREMIIEKIGPLRKKLIALDEDDPADPEGVRNSFIERVTEAAQGLPLYVIYLIGDILSGRIDPREETQLPPSLEAYYQELMRRLGVGDLQSVLAPIVATLALVREALSEGCLLSFLGGVVAEDEEGRRLVERALGVLKPMLRGTINNEGEEAYTLYHHSLAEHVRGSSQMANAVKLARRRIEDLCRRPPEPGAPNAAYLYRQGPVHLLEEGLREEASRLLDNFSWTMDLLKTLGDPAGPETLGEHWRKFGSVEEMSRSMRVIESFFRENGHILRRGTAEWPSYKIFLQLASEHADDSPITQGAEQWLEAGNCDWVWLRRTQRVQHAAVSACLAVLEGHTNFVDGALIRQDGAILSWSHDKTLRLWSSAGEPLAVLEGHTHMINGALIRQDGAIISWSDDKALRLWSQAGDPLAVLEGHTRGVAGALIREDGSILSWSDDETLRLWNSSGEPLAVLEGHTRGVAGALIREDGSILSWSDDETLRLWNSAGEPLAVLEGHTGVVIGALIREDGSILSWGDETLRLWSAAGEPLKVLEGHTDKVTGARIRQEGAILSWSWDGTLRLWSSVGEPLAILEGHTFWVTGALIREDGSVLSWSFDGALRLWSSAGEPLAELKGHTDVVNGALILEDGALLSWSNGETDLRLWSSAGEPLAFLEDHTDYVNGALIRDDGVILSWSKDQTLRLWSSAGELKEIIESHTDKVNGTLIHEDGAILSWSRDKTLRLWSPVGDPVAVLEEHTSVVDGALIREDGTILSWSRDQTLRLWSSNGEPQALLKGHTTWVYGALAREDGTILSWSPDGILRLWNSAGEPLAVLKGHTGDIYGALIRDDGSILSWSRNETLRLWSSEGEPLAILKGHTMPVNGALICEDGTILSWSFDDTLRLWSSAGEPMAVFKGHKSFVTGALIREDETILSWSDDETLRLWSATGEPLSVLEGHSDRVTGALIREDGTIISWSDDETLRLWTSDGEPISVMSYNRRAQDFPVEILPPEMKAGEFHMFAEGNTVVLFNRATGKTYLWHAGSSCEIHHLLPDGRIVTTLDDDQLCVLRLYFGNRQIGLDELSDIED